MRAFICEAYLENERFTLLSQGVVYAETAGEAAEKYRGICSHSDQLSFRENWPMLSFAAAPLPDNTHPFEVKA